MFRHKLNNFKTLIYVIFLEENKYKLAATDGPIPNAKKRVPIPTVPPKDHPAITTIISIQALTKAIGASVFFL